MTLCKAFGGQGRRSRCLTFSSRCLLPTAPRRDPRPNITSRSTAPSASVRAARPGDLQVLGGSASCGHHTVMPRRPWGPQADCGDARPISPPRRHFVRCLEFGPSGAALFRRPAGDRLGHHREPRPVALGRNWHGGNQRLPSADDRYDLLWNCPSPSSSRRPELAPRPASSAAGATVSAGTSPEPRP